MRSFGVLLFFLGLLSLAVFPPRGVAGALMLAGLILYVVGKDKRKVPKAKEAEKREGKHDWRIGTSRIVFALGRTALADRTRGHSKERLQGER